MIAWEVNSTRRHRPADDPDAEHGVCSHCNTELHFEKEPGEKIIELACSLECQRQLDWKNPVDANDIRIGPAQKKPKREPCDECGGPPNKGQGWRHIEGCKLSSTAKSDRPKREPCKECNGPPGRGLGWRHTESCSLSTANKLKAKKAAAAANRITEPCKECGGPPSTRGRGWTHSDDCPLKASNKAKAKAQEKYRANKSTVVKPPCVSCGGPASRRGWKHSDDCPLKAANKAKAKAQAKAKKKPAKVRSYPLGAV
jgi:hypothetical protein